MKKIYKNYQLQFRKIKKGNYFVSTINLIYSEIKIHEISIISCNKDSSYDRRSNPKNKPIE